MDFVVMAIPGYWSIGSFDGFRKEMQTHAAAK